MPKPAASTAATATAIPTSSRRPIASAAVAALGLLAPLALLGRRLDLAGPGDRLDRLGGPEGDRLQHSGVRQQVDQAGLDLLARRELRRQRRRGAGLEPRGERRGLD